MKILRNFIIALLIVFNLFSNSALAMANDALDNKKGSKYGIIVSIYEVKLYLINLETNKIVKEYPIAGGKSETPSPYGRWRVIDMRANWGGGFGSRWMQLSVPWGKYGIHGTNKPFSISSLASEGCIRMFNEDVEELYKYVKVGTPVVIDGGPYGLMKSAFRTLSPGDRGGDVFEVQRVMKNKGYYKGSIDGIYGEGMKADVLRFRRDYRLRETHNIDDEFYNAIGIFPFE